MKTKNEIFDEVVRIVENLAMFGAFTPWEYKHLKELEREYWEQTPIEED